MTDFIKTSNKTCLSCGSHKLSYMNIPESQLSYVLGEHLDTYEHTDHYGPMLEYHCGDCEAIMLLHVEEI